MMFSAFLSLFYSIAAILGGMYFMVTGQEFVGIWLMLTVVITQIADLKRG